MCVPDNPSYFTIAGQASPVVTPSTVTDSGVKPKRFKNWFKLKTKKNLDSQSTHYKPPCPSPEPAADTVEQQPAVLYYNLSQAINDDDVFVSNSETWTAAGGSSRTLNNHRRRHSLGSWFRFSLAAAVRSKNIAESNENRPSTSSERTLLPRNVSSSANCVRYFD